MDELELRVFKKKRSVFVENVEMNNSVMESFKSHEIFSNEECNAIMNERTQNSKVMKFFELLTVSSKTSLFEQVCMALMRSYPWLSKELQSDLKNERGNLVIDQDVQKEASMLVHRKFGTSRRLSELEKKEIQDMIALKIQISKEEWRTELQELRDELEHQTALENLKKTKSSEIAKLLTKFIKDNKDALSNNAHDMESTTQLLQSATDDEDSLSLIRKELMLILKRFNSIIIEKKILGDDREKCLKTLKLPTDTPSLHEILDNQFTSQKKKISTLENELSEKEKILKQTTKAKWDLEDSNREMNEKMTKMKNDLSDKTVKLMNFQEDIRNKQIEIDELKKNSNRSQNQQENGAANQTRPQLTRPKSKSKLTAK